MRAGAAISASVAVGAVALTLTTWRVTVPGNSAAITPDGPTCPATAKRADLNFTLTDTDGKRVRLADYKGKVLLLDFWATWCAPCKVEIPAFIELASQYRSSGFEVVGVVVQDRFSAARPFAEQFKMNYPVVDGIDRQDLEDAYGPIFGLPTSFVIARDGRICHKHIGLPSANDVKEVFAREIRSLL